VTSITEALTSFTNPKDAEQLQKLDALISQVMPEECGEEELRSLFNVFERFPEEDGYGVCNGCDEALIKSVKRKPVEFNIRMVNRLLNSGTNMVGGESLIELLSTVAEAADVLPSVRESANTFLGHQNAHGTQ